ncbi:hypothetical protein BKD02_07800 [Brucella sp. 09RB8910]|nr:hypothetical protein BKD02_07800 [Brucella sp. 09RB8910]
MAHMNVNAEGVANSFALFNPEVASVLAEVHKASTSPDAAMWFQLWRDHMARFVNLADCDTTLATELGLELNGEVGSWTFAAQTYSALVVDAIDRLVGLEPPSAPSLLDWYRVIDEKSYTACLHRISSKLPRYAITKSDCADFSDFLGGLFQTIFPPSLRHLLGEYYTPRRVVRAAAKLLTIPQDDSIKVFDPAGGSGGFVIQLLEELKARGSIARSSIVLADINPVAVRFGLTNLQFFARSNSSVEAYDYRLADTIVDEQPAYHSTLFATNVSETVLLNAVVAANDIDAGAETICRMNRQENPVFRKLVRQIIEDRFFFQTSLGANIVCGNPPWISWDGLQADYRRRVSSQWSASALITNSGWRSKVAAGKQDVSTLFVYRSAERHAAKGAQMVFALPISLFQSRHAGAGFRRFETSKGRKYALAGLLDLSKQVVFHDAINRTAVAVFRVDEPSVYPIPYYSSISEIDEGRAALAQPLDVTDLLSPIAAFMPEEDSLLKAIAPSDYRARGGINTGGANGILWVDVLNERPSAELLRIRNTAKSRGEEIPMIEGMVEAAAVSKLLLGRDVKRWKAVPSKGIILLYDPSRPKQAMPESEARRIFPQAFAYVQSFEGRLKARKEYHRWGGKGPFYEVYRIGPYTFSPVKVVWQHTGFRGRLNPAVIESYGEATIVPDQKVILLNFDNIDEAHYVCGFLASATVSEILRKYIGIDASTHILDYVGLKKFNPSMEAHIKLSDLSKLAHLNVNSGQGVVEIEEEIDWVVSEMMSK